MDESILDDILKKSSYDDFGIENSILEDLIEEINLIETDEIKSFVRSVILKSDYFLTSPEVENEPERPYDEVGPKRSIIRTKRVARIAHIMCDSYFLSKDEHDVILAAALLHDVGRYKDFSIEGKVYQVYDPMHPYSVASHIYLCQDADKETLTDSVSTTLFITQEQMFSILRLIRCQLGADSPIPETYPVTYMDHILHASIRIASSIHSIIEDSELFDSKWHGQS